MFGRRYFGRLHRQLFAGFAVAIVVTLATVLAVLHLTGSSAGWWRREVEQVQHFAAGRFAAAWNEPRERHALAAAIARDFRAGVLVRDDRGRVLDSIGMPARCRWGERVDVVDHGRLLGRVAICLDRHRQAPRPWVFTLVLAVAVSVLWLFAGMAARRMARPLRELTRVTREIGEGNLASRVRLRHGRHGEVGQLTTAINEMATRIERQLRTQQELLAAVSHEMRTPLARMRVLLEIARDRGNLETVVDGVEQEIVEMDALVGDLLAGARLDFGALAPRSLDVRELAGRAWERSSIAKGALDVPEGDGAGAIVADATLLGRALGALLDNAKKHGGKTITMRVRGTSDRVAFEVDDDGPGFGPGEESKVFEPFYRGGGRPPDESRGVGLGLALVRRIAEAHGGRAYAENLPSGGARVAITLPRAGRSGTSIGHPRA